MVSRMRAYFRGRILAPDRRGIVHDVNKHEPSRPDSFAVPAASGTALPPDGAAMLAVYGRPVTWRMLVLTAVVLLVLMATSAFGVVWWVWHNLAARVVIQEQQALVQLPPELAVRAAVSEQVQVTIDEVLPITVPIDQTLTIPLNDTLPVRVSIDTTLPIAIDVPVRQVIPLDQVVDVDATVRTKVLGIPMTVPVKGRIPIKADVPLDVVIPVRHTLPLVLSTDAQVRLQEPLRVKVNTLIQAQVPIQRQLSLPINEPVQATLSFPQRTVSAGLQLLDLTVPFTAVSFAPREGTMAAQWWSDRFPRQEPR